MYTIHLTDDELELASNSLHAYLRAFGHREADTVEQIKRVIAKFRDAERDDEEPSYIG
jgi:hypothetical protein